MSQLPLSIGRIHFTGIGGIGMSGIAEILHEMGYQVQGSDLGDNANVVRLREKGINIAIGQTAENIAEASILVISTAIRPDNPEVMEARRRFLPVVHRSETLGELMRLHNGDDAVFRFQHPGCAEGGPNFNRVMTVIINDHDITRTALEFKAAANAAETVQPYADCLNGNPHL